VFGAGTAALLNALRWAVLSDFAFVGEQPYISKRHASLNAPGLMPTNQDVTGTLPHFSAPLPTAHCIGNKHSVT
jgi:hypothetical protein